MSHLEDEIFEPHDDDEEGDAGAAVDAALGGADAEAAARVAKAQVELAELVDTLADDGVVSGAQRQARFHKQTRTFMAFPISLPSSL